MKRFYPAICFIVLFVFADNAFSQTAGDYRSFVATGDWSVAANWERFNGAVWVNPAPSAPTSTDNAITIQSGHTITISTTVTADQLAINAGGALTISSTGNLTIADGTGNDLTCVNNTSLLNVSGTVRLNNSALMSGNTATNTNFLSGGIYQLNYTTTAGMIPLATWNVSSTCEIIGYTSNTTNPTNLNQSFGNFTYNCTGQTGIVNFNGLLTTVTGNLTISNTGAVSASIRVVFTTTQHPTINVTGNFTIQNNARVFLTTTFCNLNIGGNFNFTSGNTWGTFMNYSGTTNVTIGGNFTMAAGSTGNIKMCNAATTAFCIFNLSGNLIYTSGKLIENSSVGGTSTINFLGTNQTFTGGSTFQNTIHFVVGNGAAATTLNVNGAISGSDGNFTINNLSAANVSATGSISGTDLNLNSGGTLRLASTSSSGALQTGTTAGNIRVSGTRTYNANSTIEYNGTSLQFTGNGLTTPGDVVFNNPTAVALSQALSTPRNITISAGQLSANIDLNLPITLTGNWTNNANFFAGTGTVTFNGTTAQTISGANSGFYDLTISNASSTVTLLSDQDLTNTLTLGNNSHFVTTGQVFSLLSSSSNTARIATIPATATFTGNITMYRFAPSGRTGWAFFGSPCSGQTLADWDDDIFTSGFTGADGSAGSFVSILTYDETVAGVFDNGYVNATNETNPIGIGQGFWVYFGTGASTTTDITLDLTGQPITGNQTLPTSYTVTSGGSTEDGWNLVANPYPSAIDWNSPAWTKTNIDNAIYVYNADLNSGAGDYASYVSGVSSPAVGSGGIDNVIPSSQGFYVHASGAPTLSVTESVKTTGNPTFRSEEEVGEVFRIQLLADNNMIDETAFRMDENGTVEFNQTLDAKKMFGAKPFAVRTSIYSKFDDNAYVIKSIPFDFASSIPLHIRNGAAGTYTIKAIDILALSTTKQIVLEDMQNGALTDLEINDSYIFNSDGNWSEENPRFIIHFRNKQQGTTNNISESIKEPVFISKADGVDVIFNYSEYKDVEISVHNILGQKITADKKVNVKSEKININIADQVSGVYFITLKTNSKTTTKKFIK